MFYNGLPDRIKDKIARVGKPPRLVDLRTMAQGIDARYWECKSEIARQAKTNPQSSSSKQSSSGGSSSKQSKQPRNVSVASRTFSASSVGFLAIRLRTALGPRLTRPRPALSKQPP
ncbi:hypothetical protein ID866_12567 [Astraeus odoratus]|nr:hypothetical protein ID866_12567 [Astraeus odoratus]